ncbi:MAG TPA: hypothetical protein VMC10_20445 [Stellaceae bacterium]|nr:hypothetical protein [Stellaceae bacterium]
MMLSRGSPMAMPDGGSDHLNWRERLLAICIVASLALPFIPVPGDGTAHMKLIRNDAVEPKPVKVSTEAPRSVCEVLAFSLAYEDPATGAYQRVHCK